VRPGAAPAAAAVPRYRRHDHFVWVVPFVFLMDLWGFYSHIMSTRRNERPNPGVAPDRRMRVSCTLGGVRRALRHVTACDENMRLVSRLGHITVNWTFGDVLRRRLIAVHRQAHDLRWLCSLSGVRQPCPTGDGGPVRRRGGGRRARPPSV
jgi:hypothetical protein